MSNQESIKVGEIVMPCYQGVHGSTHRLMLDWSVAVALPDGRAVTITVRAGFTFDGASIPRALWRVCGHPLEVPRVAAGLAHDWLYASHAVDRKTADLIYKALCVKLGVASWRAGVEYAALRLCGGAAWRGHGEQDNAAARNQGAISICTNPKE